MLTKCEGTLVEIITKLEDVNDAVSACDVPTFFVMHAFVMVRVLVDYHIVSCKRKLFASGEPICISSTPLFCIYVVCVMCICGLATTVDNWIRSCALLISFSC